jgi:hypothetical protein
MAIEVKERENPTRDRCRWSDGTATGRRDRSSGRVTPDRWIGRPRLRRFISTVPTSIVSPRTSGVVRIQVPATDRSGVCLRFGVCILAATRCSSMLSDPPTPHWRRQQPRDRASGHPDRVYCDRPASLRAVHSRTVVSVGPWLRAHGTDHPEVGTTACRPWIPSCRVEACSVGGCRPGPGCRGHTRE